MDGQQANIEDPSGTSSESAADRHGRDDGLVGPGAHYGDGTHVGSSEDIDTSEVENERAAHRDDEADPEALVAGNRVGDGTELENDGV